MGVVGGGALLVGAVLGLTLKVGLRVIGLVEHAGRLMGLLTVLGFAVAFFLSAP